MRGGLHRAEAAAVAAVAALLLGALGVRAWRGAGGATDVRPARVDLNAASREELEALPGVGPRAAERLVAGRPWTRLEDVRAALGDEVFRGLAGSVSLGDAAAVASGPGR